MLFFCCKTIVLFILISNIFLPELYRAKIWIYFFSDINEYKKYYFYRRHYNLIFFLAKINRININCIKLDKKILKIKIKIFRFRRQYKLFFCYLRKLGDRKARNIENIQKIEKKLNFVGVLTLVLLFLIIYFLLFPKPIGL